MAKVILIQVVYNNRKFIEPVFSAMVNQTFTDIEIVAVIAGNDDGGKELIAEKFPQVKIIDPKCNIGFAKGHNLVFESFRNCEFFQLVNPDLVMEQDYVEKLLQAFEDPKVGAATGKLYQIPESGIMNYELWKREAGKKILDTTGVVIFKSGAARDRGQHEIDVGQYDKDTSIQAVSAAGAMYRRAALQATSYKLLAGVEYFDVDFHSYWEDVDLAWRMTNAGYKCVFVPSAIAYHGRGAGSSKGGYKKVFSYIKFHSKLNPRIRQLNYQNHIFMYIKNSPWFYPQFFIRELAMLAYIVLFEISTLKVVPNIIKLLPKMWQKRRLLQNKTL